MQIRKIVHSRVDVFFCYCSFSITSDIHLRLACKDELCRQNSSKERLWFYPEIIYAIYSNFWFFFYIFIKIRNLSNELGNGRTELVKKKNKLQKTSIFIIFYFFFIWIPMASYRILSSIYKMEFMTEKYAR